MRAGEIVIPYRLAPARVSNIVFVDILHHRGKIGLGQKRKATHIGHFLLLRHPLVSATNKLFSPVVFRVVQVGADRCNFLRGIELLLRLLLVALLRSFVFRNVCCVVCGFHLLCSLSRNGCLLRLGCAEGVLLILLLLLRLPLTGSLIGLRLGHEALVVLHGILSRLLRLASRRLANRILDGVDHTKKLIELCMSN
ncbi:hypothetical protein B0G73_11657 [Paraburkholderia sp. BL25I1N1]|nr:hypothetical protein B0G73_11657 [Paraburkholderia sp. BL25I1N1]